MYFYVLGYDPDELELAQAEALTLTGGELVSPRIVCSERRVDIAASAYLTLVAELLASAASADELAASLRCKALAADAFKIDVRKHPRGLPLLSHELATQIADAIQGHPDLDRPKITFLAAATERGIWFGRELPAEAPRWQRFRDKPYDFSSALPARVARAVVNLAAKPGQHIVDPCCGSGSILLHAADMGIRVTGWDINPRMVGMSRRNLEHFGLTGDVNRGDAAEVKGSFDAVVVNLPYGRFCLITPDKYGAILRNCRRLAPQAVFVTTVPSDALLQELGFRIDRILRTGETLACRTVYCCSSR